MLNYSLWSTTNKTNYNWQETADYFIRDWENYKKIESQRTDQDLISRSKFTAVHKAANDEEVNNVKEVETFGAIHQPWMNKLKMK